MTDKPTDEALREVFAQCLTSTYMCGRAWSAWGIGTMSEDDFSPASECDELLDELVNTHKTINAPLVAPVRELAPIQWPKARDIGRYGDMSPHAHIRVGFDSDNDVYVSVWDEKGGASIEFCQPGAGGGKSSKTRMALIALMAAMEEDNAQTPHLDWWAKRLGAKP